MSRPTVEHLRRWASSDDAILVAAANEALTFRQALIDVCEQWASQFGPRSRAAVEAALSADDANANSSTTSPRVPSAVKNPRAV